MEQKQINDVQQMELVLERIPTKELYKLNIRVVHKVQSRARSNATNLEITREEKEVLETVLKETHIEHEKDKRHAYIVEKILEEVFQRISDNALIGEISTE
jgi:hypothetical protein